MPCAIQRSGWEILRIDKSKRWKSIRVRVWYANKGRLVIGMWLISSHTAKKVSTNRQWQIDKFHVFLSHIYDFIISFVSVGEAIDRKTARIDVFDGETSVDAYEQCVFVRWRSFTRSPMHSVACRYSIFIHIFVFAVGVIFRLRFTIFVS